MIREYKTPMFTQRHYEALAGLIQKAKTDNKNEMQAFINLLSGYLCADNPRFNLRTFYIACGIET